MSHLANIEALLFVAGEDGLGLKELAGLLDLPPQALTQQLDKLKERYDQDDSSAICLLETGRAYRLVTKERHAELLKVYAKTPTNQSLSRASLETLSIIAYKQPITRVEVDEIRGVNSSGAIAKLLAFGLVAEVGKKEVLGRPNLYATTTYFLDYMGINDLAELPDVSSIQLVDDELTLFASDGREQEEDEENNENQ